MDNKTPSLRKRTQRDYNEGFKLAVVEQVEKGEMTYKQAQKSYDIQGRSTVLHLSLGMKTPEEVHEKAGCEWQPA